MIDPHQQACLMREVSEARSKSAFTRLFQWYAPRICVWLRQRGASVIQAEELAQDVMLDVWRQASRYDPGRASVAAWVFTIARNKHVDRIRRERRPNPEHDGLLVPAPSPDLGEATGVAQRRGRVHAALQQLPDAQAAVIRSTFLDEETQQRAADLHGVPLGTIKSRTRLAFGRLRELLSADGPDD